MENYTKEFRVKPKHPVKLKNLKTHWEAKHITQENSKSDIEKYLVRMDQLQYLMFSENKKSLLIVLQGMDAAGKDGVVRHVLTGMNPEGCVVSAFKEPTARELSHDFLWRVHPHAPGRGSVAIFNRSHYEDVLITRVHKTITAQECAARYDRINDFEKLLVEENNTTILKFFSSYFKKRTTA